MLNMCKMRRRSRQDITSNRGTIVCRFSSSAILQHRPRLITITLCETKDIYHEYKVRSLCNASCKVIAYP
jgi:hypothetical protein